MKHRTIRTTIAAIALLASATTMATAQLGIDKNREVLSPSQQFGFGVNNAGLHIQYAMGPAFHLGLNLNLDVNSTDQAKPDIYDFGPYAKFIFSGSVIKPYLFGAVGVLKPGSGRFGIQGRTGQPDSLYVKLPDSELSIRLAAGAEHFFSQNLGVYGHVNMLSVLLSPPPSVVRVGLLGAVAGMEFFF